MEMSLLGSIELRKLISSSCKVLAIICSDPFTLEMGNDNSSTETEFSVSTLIGHPYSCANKGVDIRNARIGKKRSMSLVKAL